jgi:hypothetical protein
MDYQLSLFMKEITIISSVSSARTQPLHQARRPKIPNLYAGMTFTCVS